MTEGGIALRVLNNLTAADEFTRVHLATPAGHTRYSDYINANYIEVNPSHYWLDDTCLCGTGLYEEERVHISSRWDFFPSHVMIM